MRLSVSCSNAVHLMSSSMVYSLTIKYHATVVRTGRRNSSPKCNKPPPKFSTLSAVYINPSRVLITTSAYIDLIMSILLTFLMFRVADVSYTLIPAHATRPTLSTSSIRSAFLTYYPFSIIVNCTSPRPALSRFPIDICP